MIAVKYFAGVTHWHFSHALDLEQVAIFQAQESEKKRIAVYWAQDLEEEGAGNQHCLDQYMHMRHQSN